MLLAYHNHAFEFETFCGDRPGYDVLLAEADPGLVAMEMDLYWTVHAGHDPVAYFDRYPGRFPVLHLKDRTPGGAMADVGGGGIDFARVFARAEQAGLRHAFVEHDEPRRALPGSIRGAEGHGGEGRTGLTFWGREPRCARRRAWGGRRAVGVDSGRKLPYDATYCAIVCANQDALRIREPLRAPRSLHGLVKVLYTVPMQEEVSPSQPPAASQAYRWEDWTAVLPPYEQGSGRTHGVAVTDAGHVIVFRQADPAVLVFDEGGALLDAWGNRFLGAHGLTLVREGGRELLWLTDQDSGEVVKTTLDGETLLRLERPTLAAYDGGTYAPTWVAVSEERLGGDGSVWVADGYGEDLVHRYDHGGRYLSTLDGTEGAGAFDCPHGIWIAARHDEPELYVADRGNRRLQVYDLEGRFKRVAGEGVLECPCVGVVQGDELVVAELCARLAVLDRDDRLVGYLGRNEAVCDREGWPDLAPRYLHTDAFNSPHGIAAAADGSLYVVEWIVGGRFIKLTRA